MWVIIKRPRLFIVVLSGILFIPISVFALGLAPTAVDLSVIQGNQADQIFLLGNEKNVVKTFRIELIGIQFGSHADELSFLPISDDQKAWMTLTPSFATLEKGQVAEIALRIAPYAHVESGLYPVGIQVVEEASDNSGVNVESGVVALAFVTVGNDVQTSGELIDVSLSHTLLAKPITIHTTLRNTGAGMLQPQGTVQIKNLFGHVVEEFSLNEHARRIPPDQTRTFSQTWGMEEGDGFIKHIQYEIRQPAIGLFTIEMRTHFIEGDAEQMMTRHVFLFPWRFTLLFLTVVIVGFGVIRYTR